MKGVVTILGCGPSGGIPGIGNYWGKCDPENPRNKRLRPSIHIEMEDVGLLVDTAPDLRTQLLLNNISKVDAVLFTHGHADHLHGIDDLRSLNRIQNKALDIYLNEETLEHVEQRFGYVLGPLAEGAEIFYKPVLNAHVIEAGLSFRAAGVGVMPIRQDHGFCESLGFRIGNFAYSTDVVDMEPEEFDRLKGIETWIIGTLVDKPHATHCDVDKALKWIETIKPKKAYLTHLGSGLDYQELCNKLPSHVRPCFDGLKIEIESTS